MQPPEAGEPALFFYCVVVKKKKAMIIIFNNHHILKKRVLASVRFTSFFLSSFLSLLSSFPVFRFPFSVVPFCPDKKDIVTIFLLCTVKRGGGEGRVVEGRTGWVVGTGKYACSLIKQQQRAY